MSLGTDLRKRALSAFEILRAAFVKLWTKNLPKRVHLVSEIGCSHPPKAAHLWLLLDVI